MKNENSCMSKIPFQELLRTKKELPNLRASTSSLKKWKKNAHTPRHIDDINTILLTNGKTFNDYIDELKEEEITIIECNIPEEDLLILKKKAQKKAQENNNSIYNELIKKIDSVLSNNIRE